MPGLLFALLATIPGLVAPLAAQTTIAIANSSFELPTPSTYPDYTIGATDWTLTIPATNAGTFVPGYSGTTPAPIAGSQVGYADGYGGLQQVLGVTFAANQVYTYSVYIGYRSDALESVPFGTGAITLGYFESETFTPLSTQSTTVGRGSFSFVTGSFQPAGAALGRPIAIRLTSTDSYQVLFDQVQLSYTAIPEPSVFALALGAGVLGIAWWRRRGRSR
jgi:hypothetical protein